MNRYFITINKTKRFSNKYGISIIKFILNYLRNFIVYNNSFIIVNKQKK